MFNRQNNEYPRNKRTRPLDRDGGIEWLMGEDFLPETEGTALLWQALRQLGATVGPVVRMAGFTDLRQVVLPWDWTKHSAGVIYGFPQRSKAMEVRDSNGNLRLQVTFSNLPDQAPESDIRVISRYEVRKHLERPEDEATMAAVDRWTANGSDDRYDVLMAPNTELSKESQEIMAIGWLDRNRADWRYPLLTWGIKTTPLQRWAYRRQCRRPAR